MRSKILLLAIVFFVLPNTATAQDSKEAFLQVLYGKAGLEEQVLQLPMVVQVGFDQAVATDDRLKAMPRTVIGEIRASIETVFAPENIKRAILSECREKLSIDDLKKVLAWLDSPLGRKFTQLEEAASTPEKYTEMQQFAQMLQESPPLPERLEIIGRLDEAAKATETSVEVAMNTQLAITIAIVASLPKEQRPTYDNLAAVVEQTRPQIESAMRAQTIVSLLYTYRNVTETELDQYIEFASYPTGKNYHDAVVSGLKKALLEGSYAWGKAIADILTYATNTTEV
ncbi:hypothetical protein DSCW_30400 [Desulfosarcina widdelii]|uniref:DUF2059 domain-containing protein n=1 Tax=Desulfosarcina widdelii TaxID=947919 RepID=A0A5K7Z6X2_9BACT|nr:DUF2059 domain-containing protein [Desulfosarcina widdelii]BBO75623.1 hypothetical protein DSCW_30400 [Desulfosarcina widdelii]